jgi:hypothetical protein
MTPTRARHTRPVAALLLVPFAAATLGAGCGSGYTIVDRSTLVISDNARVSAISVLPGAQKNARATNHLALAQEVYQKQLDLLKERRNKVRARRRWLNMLSYGALAAATIAVSSVALASDSRSTQRTVGGVGLGAVGLGTALQIGGLMQEEPGTVDEKIRHLQSIYEAMLQQVRVLATQPQSDHTDAAIGTAIEAFINEALRINVKG